MSAIPKGRSQLAIGSRLRCVGNSIDAFKAPIAQLSCSCWPRSLLVESTKHTHTHTHTHPKTFAKELYEILVSLQRRNEATLIASASARLGTGQHIRCSERPTHARESRTSNFSNGSTFRTRKHRLRAELIQKRLSAICQWRSSLVQQAGG